VVDYVLSGLVKRRGELAGEIENTQTKLNMLIIDLNNLDATIRIFKPDIDLLEVKPLVLPPRNHAFRGEVTRIVLSLLREYDHAASTREIALQVMVARGLNTADRLLVKTVEHRTGSCLRHQRKVGLVRSAPGPAPDNLLCWQLVR
jgi:hypothetical protein